MKKATKIGMLILAFGLTFAAGWRIMPQAWPKIKEAVLYPVFPEMKPEPTATLVPYEPKSRIMPGEDILQTDSLIYYFYRDSCQYCRLLDPLIAGLPNNITLADGTVSNIKLICLNKSEEPDLKIINQYYKDNDIIKDRQLFPSIVIGDRYLTTRQEIIPQLMNSLVSGEGLSTPLLDGGHRKYNKKD